MSLNAMSRGRTAGISANIGTARTPMKGAAVSLGRLQRFRSTDSTVDRSFEALSKFIPTELLAPYLGALSLSTSQKWNQTTIYILFIIVTPFAFLLFKCAKSALAKEQWPKILPLFWRATAATSAFAVWGLSAPSNPYQIVIGGPAVAGFIAILISPILFAFDAIIMRLLKEDSFD